MIAPTAPAFCAFWIFVPNVHTPRLMTAILPETLFVIAAHPAAGIVFAVFPVIGGTKFAKAPIAAPSVVPWRPPNAASSSFTEIPM